MLFDSALRRELSRSFSATLVVIVTIVMTMVLIRTLGRASSGSINPRDVLLLMGYLVLAYMPMVLGLSLLISITSALSRMYKDSEMAVWFAAGQGLADFVAPVLRFAWPVVLGIAGAALIGWPWANQQMEELKFAYQARSDLQRVTPGQFQENKDGSRVFFIDKDTPSSQEGRNIFILQRKADKDVLITARAGRVESIDGHRYLMLDNGHQLEEKKVSHGEKVNEEAGLGFTTASFARYGVYLSPEDNEAVRQLPVKARSTLQLLEEAQEAREAGSEALNKRSRIALGQLSWRVGVALSACNVLLLGLLIAGGNPRAGKSIGMVLAFCSFFVYYNFISLGERWIAAGKYGFVSYLVVLHVGVLLFSLSWLWKRHTGFEWRVWLRRRNRTSSHKATNVAGAAGTTRGGVA